MTEKEIARLYKKAKPQVHTKEYYRMQHEKHKEKRNASRRAYATRQKTDVSKLNWGLL